MKTTLDKSAKSARKAVPNAPAALRRAATLVSGRTAKQANGHAALHGSRRTEAAISALLGIRLK